MWYRSPPVPHGHVPCHNMRHRGARRAGVELRRCQWRRVVASTLWAGGAAVLSVCRSCAVGAVWRSVLHASGLDDPHVMGEVGALVVVCRWSSHCEVFRMPDEGGTEGIEDLAHEGRRCCWCFILRADCGQRLSRRQRLDLVDREDRAQIRRGAGIRPVVVWDDLRLLPAIQLEPPCRRPLLGVLLSSLGPPPVAVGGVPWVPAAGPAGHDGCQGVWRLVWGQNGRAIRQGHAPGEHGVDGTSSSRQRASGRGVILTC